MLAIGSSFGDAGVLTAVFFGASDTSCAVFKMLLASSFDWLSISVAAGR